MDNNTNTQTQITSPETQDRLVSLAADINKKIDDINALLKDRWAQDATKEENKKELETWGKEAVTIIEGDLPEEEILKKLEEIYQKITKEEGADKGVAPIVENIATTVQKETTTENPPEQEEGKKEEKEDADKKTDSETENIPEPEKKENPTERTPEQEAEDIIHAAESGLPMFISGRTKRVVETLGMEILPTDKPNDVLEKLKNRLKNGPQPKILFGLAIPAKIPENKDVMPPSEKKEEEIIKTQPIEDIKTAPLNELDAAMERRILLRELIAKEKQKSSPDTEDLREKEEELNRLEDWIPRKQKQAREAEENSHAKKIEDLKGKIDGVLSPETPKTTATESPTSAEEKKREEKPPEKQTLSDILLGKLGV
jgi:hypothetical protein